MTDTDLAQLRAALREELRAILPEVTINGTAYKVDELHHILTRAECRGRWSRARLDLALAREAGTAHVPANLRK